MAEPDQLLTVEEVADRLRLSHPTVRRRLLEGLIPALNVGTRTRPTYRVRERDLADYVRRSQLGPADTSCA